MFISPERNRFEYWLKKLVTLLTSLGRAEAIEGAVGSMEENGEVCGPEPWRGAHSMALCSVWEQETSPVWVYCFIPALDLREGEGKVARILRTDS